MSEQWRLVDGFEDCYMVSDQGRVRSLDKLQRYEHGKTGEEMFRRVKGRIISFQRINSGYNIVHLYRENRRTALLVHRLVAFAFCPRDAGILDVNHIDGVKTNNAATNLEWITRTKNHLHAVDLRLNKQAIPVVSKVTGKRFASLAQAAKALHTNHTRVVSRVSREDDICPV